jgi:hypothetical protein
MPSLYCHFIVKAKGLYDPVGYIDERVGNFAKKMYLEKLGIFL